jgi:hypothetical protein
MVVFPLILLLTLAPSTPDAKKLADFSRMSKAIHMEVALIDSSGVIREGRLIAATADALTLATPSGQRSFQRAEIAGAERIRDGRRDGLIKGMVFGAVTGIFAVQGLRTPAQGVAAWFGSIAIYGGVGWALDAAQTHREPLYRAPAANPAPQKPGLTLSVRF